MNQLPHYDFFGLRALLLPCRMPVEHLLDAEAYLKDCGYRAILFDPERPNETPLREYDWIYILNKGGVPAKTKAFLDQLDQVDTIRRTVVKSWG